MRRHTMSHAFLFLWQFLVCLSVATHEQTTSALVDAGPKYDPALDDGSYGYYPVHTYASNEDVVSPQTNFLTWSSRCDDGLFVFITPRGWGIERPGPMLLDQRGELMWAHHFDNNFGGQAYNFKVQSYQNEDYLTFWLGDDRVKGHGAGAYYMLNSSYDIVRRVDAANDLSADLHEFLITPEGTALITVYEPVVSDLSDTEGYESIAGDHPQTYIWDCLFQELSLDHENLLFEWRASDHIPIEETYRPIGPGDGSEEDPFDWYHLNSIEKDDVGNYLISARLTHSIYYIDGDTGQIIWTLGGKRNDFMDLSDGDAINFAWQHDARFLASDAFPALYQAPEQRDGYKTVLLSMFDNSAQDLRYDYGLPFSRGLLLELTYPSVARPNSRSTFASRPQRANVVDAEPAGEKMDINVQKISEINGTSSDYIVRVIQSYENPQELRSSSQGSMQVINGGRGHDSKVFVGYGLNAVWTEFDADGTVLCDVHYGADTSWERGDIQSYRAYKSSWIGHPRAPPRVKLSDDEAELFVSWNGATEVSEWILQCSDYDRADDETWEDAMRLTKDGFESVFMLPEDVLDFRFLRVIALDNQGRTLAHGTSRSIDRGYDTYLSSIADKLQNDTIGASPVSIVLILLSTAAGLHLVLHMYRRHLHFKTYRREGPRWWRLRSEYFQSRNTR